MATTPATTAVHQVNLPFSYYHRRSKGTSLPQETRYRTPLRETLRSLANWKKHKLCLLSIPLQLHLLQRLSERTTSLQSLFVQRTTMEPLPHGLLVLSSSKPLTGRTGQAEGRFSYWKHHEPQPVPQEYSTGQGLVPQTTCLVGTPPLRLQLLLHLLQERRDKPKGSSQPSRRQTPSHRAPGLTPTSVNPPSYVLDIQWPS